MKEWKTNLHLNHTQGNTTCKNLKIKCGIFQADPLHLLPFCLVLVPLSYELNENETGYGYHIYETIIICFTINPLTANFPII